MKKSSSYSSVSDLKTRPKNRSLLYLLIGLVCQVFFWYFASPGPQISGFSDQGRALEIGIQGCGLSVVLLMVVPLLIMLLARDDPRRLPIGLVDYKFGMRAICVFGPILIVGTALGSFDESLIRFYPIPGNRIAENLSTFFLWTVWYGCFYVSFEFFYRGFLLFGTDDIGLFNCFLIQLCCCVLIHMGKPLAETLASIPASILFAWLVIRTGSIWYSFAIHYAVGITNDLAALFQRGEFFLD